LLNHTEGAYAAHYFAVFIAHEGGREGDLAPLSAVAGRRLTDVAIAELLVSVHAATSPLSEGFAVADLFEFSEEEFTASQESPAHDAS
jgi:hypothetical protein